MKKTLLTLATVATFAAAANTNTTINATMDLMEDGMATIQKGFLYNQKDTIIKGIKTVENANNIFDTVDIKEFTNGNNKVQVISNIHGNIAKDIKALKELIHNNKYSDAAATYGKVVNDCVSCHTVIRGW